MNYRTRIAAYASAVGLSLAACMIGLRGYSAPLLPSSTTTEANITRVTTSLLEHSQLSHHPLDNEVAGEFLKAYLSALDGTHSVFLQSDVDEFAKYRSTLGQVTRSQGDTSAARVILKRYLERLQARTDYSIGRLRTAKFDFTAHDVYSFEREHAPYPHDLAAAQALWWQQLRAEYLQEKLEGTPAGKIVSDLTRRHSRELQTMRSLQSDEILELYLDALAHVYDPHSDYLGHEQMENLSIAMNLSLFGIGAVLESTPDGYCKIRELVPGGPAARGGQLKPGDRIVAVAQPGKEPVDIVNMPISRAVELIRGPKGSPVTLSVIPAAAADTSLPKKVSLVRDEIQLEDERAKARMLDLRADNGSKLRLGIIDLPSFYSGLDKAESDVHRSATADVATLLVKLNAEHVQGVVLDLRRNGGGSLDEAVKLTGLFIKRGPVVQTRESTGEIQVDADEDATQQYGGPLVVLTSRFSASASEILAGALQDYGRAVVVGDSSTFGKGTVQTLLPLAHYMDERGLAYAYDPGALKITISKFYRPGGSSTQLRGVASDIVLPVTSDSGDVGESAMENPLPWDSVPQAHFTRLNLVQPYIDKLRARSMHRMKSEKAFIYLERTMTELRKALGKKTLSLNEAERRRELAENKTRESEIELETKAHPETWPTTYEITATSATKLGLPAPTPFVSNPSKSETDAGDEDSKRDALMFAIISNEAVHILADYVGLLRPGSPVNGG